MIVIKNLCKINLFCNDYLCIFIQIKNYNMKVKKLIELLSKFDGEMKVLGEFDSDGDDFMVKIDVKKVYKGNGCDDSWDGDGNEDEKKYCIIMLK